jgi:hypothetical protein
MHAVRYAVLCRCRDSKEVEASMLCSWVSLPAAIHQPQGLLLLLLPLMLTQLSVSTRPEPFVVQAQPLLLLLLLQKPY